MVGRDKSVEWPCMVAAMGVYRQYPLCILVCFPLIVAMGAGSSVTGANSSAINKFLGEISYPIYITHYPLIYMQMSWADSHKDAPLCTHLFVSVCIFVLAILLAYAAYKLYDLPVRELLKKKWFR
jgi:peptidoglycan/LPS O-acetylase OafA/YrhL